MCKPSKVQKVLAAMMHIMDAAGLNKTQRHDLYRLLKNAIKDDMPTRKNVRGKGK